jgi:predicted NUDIX family NTP pyrophosphohydrolase
MRGDGKIGAHQDKLTSVAVNAKRKEAILKSEIRKKSKYRECSDFGLRISAAFRRHFSVHRRAAAVYLRPMSKVSAGLLMYRVREGELEVLLAHPGGPFWINRDAGAWTIPKGEIQEDEEPLAAARREFEEEIGLQPQGEFIALQPITQKSGKLVHAWAFEGECDTTCIRSNTFQMEWPPRSGKFQAWPEVDRACFFRIKEAKEKINPAQVAFLQELENLWRRV